MRITHMTPRMQQGLWRQVEAPIKYPAFGDEDDGENDDDEEVYVSSRHSASKDSSRPRSVRGPAQSQNLRESRRGSTSRSQRTSRRQSIGSSSRVPGVGVSARKARSES